MSELKPLPCPFCGGEPNFPAPRDVVGSCFDFGCEHCGFAMNSVQIIDCFDFGDDREEAQDSWNPKTYQYGLKFIEIVRNRMIEEWNKRDNARVKELEAAITKMIKCKGRYHTEQNTIALAKLVGIDLPATEQPCKHDWQATEPEHVNGIVQCRHCSESRIVAPVKIKLPNYREYNAAYDLGADFCDAIQPAIDAGVIEVMEE